MLTNILLIIIILHLIAGFGFILWKVAGPVERDNEKDDKNDN